jgi:tRNA modification GTPase
LILAATDTVAAIATPPGFGGVGIVRISGPLTVLIAEAVLGARPAPRTATFTTFRDTDGAAIDQGIALYFPAPRSFTGEDVLELQGHGGPVVMDLLLRRVLAMGARLARPGEFSERAFVNGKIDLAQAEAIADLIESATETAARLAARTLEGVLSRRVADLVEGLIHLRTFVEAALDFPDEDIDLLTGPQVATQAARLVHETRDLIASARQGQLVREGLQVVIAGPPNAGKSSLLNALCGTDRAIVTAVPGTTRDLLREAIQIDGMPLHLIDTAGLRPSADPIEQEGIRRARRQIEQADQVLWVFDGLADPEHRATASVELPARIPVTFVRNKVDLTGFSAGRRDTPAGVEIAVSALTGAGLDALRAHLKAIAGFQGADSGEFLARRRHLDALERALEHLEQAQLTLAATGGAELAAEDLRQAQQTLGEITGAFTSEDLLGRIFAGFCIGK